MNMNRSRKTASTISTFLNPIKRSLGIKKSNSRGTNALFRAISAEDWELVITVCDTKPYKAERWHNAVGFFDAHRSSKILPLHQACIFHPTKDAIHHIIQAYPEALRATESGYGRVPLHIACHSNASFDCIRELASQYPAASVERDIIGRVPLHYALSNGAASEIVEELLKASAEAYGSGGKQRICSVSDFNGWLPIHVACFMGASARVLNMLVKAYPEGVDCITKKNSTPMSLLRGISLSPQKKEALEAILLRSKNKQSVKYAARISPARTDMDKVVRMSDETCSKGVTLEIDEDETSSLSSMEATTATVRTGTTNKRRELSRRHLQFGGDTMRVGPPPEMANLRPMTVIEGVPGHHNESSAAPRPPHTSLLPTHEAYGGVGGNSSNHLKNFSSIPLPLVTRASTDTSNPSNPSVGAIGGTGGGGPAPGRQNPFGDPGKTQTQGLMYPPPRQGPSTAPALPPRHETAPGPGPGPIPSSMSSMQQKSSIGPLNRLRSRSSSGTASGSRISNSSDSHETKPIFQPITSTAVFC